jgi:hypothetical protein
MRWIQHGDKIKRGEVAPPEGDLFFVDTTGSKALVGGALYVDGVKAAKGQHKIVLKDADLTISVDSKGKSKRGGVAVVDSSTSGTKRSTKFNSK